MARRTDPVDDLQLALSAVREAGRVVMESFRTVQEVRHKSPDQPVTQADLQADALLAERLLSARPDYGWLSEETVDRPDRLSRSRVWVVDPIDGTRSFIAGYAEFGISVGLIEDAAPVLGVILNPAREEMFWAVRGGGAFLRCGAGAELRLRMSEPAPDDRPSLLASRSEIRRGEFHLLEEGHEILELGSTAYKMAGVAAGHGHAFLSRGPKSEWDVAAGVLIVEEAGGVATDLDGRVLVFNRPDPSIDGIVVAPPGLHGELLGLVRGMGAVRPRAAGDGEGGVG
ncbi:MAG TPA: 3'(2'),5'-bisphosphate nucleotidase CysQ [Longimicrobiales bacterium]|nr:3'(2'),5'-bisphosphate nucleotidase CysQ [Longimicrobiales bacterium]